jgi:glucosamine-6-phosphate deaminase
MRADARSDVADSAAPHRRSAPDRRVCDDAGSFAEAAASEIAAALREKPDLVLCLPTGRTPRAVYRRLVARHAAGELRFDASTLLMVDEYVGLGPDDPGSFAGYLREHLIRHVDADPAKVHLIDGRAADPAAEAARYEAAIAAAGGIDLLMLGVGTNGHLGFNEPGSARGSRTRVVALTADTLAANAPDLEESPVSPTHAITIGLGNILEARRVLLLAAGAAKAEPLRRLFECDTSGAWPVAVLCDHPNVVAILDREAYAGAAAPASGGSEGRAPPAG